MFSSVSAPFCWPTTATGRPSSRARPATIAGSSPNRRSPCSSTNSSVIASTNSSVCGRRRLRASWTRAQTRRRWDRCRWSASRSWHRRSHPAGSPDRARRRRPRARRRARPGSRGTTAAGSRARPSRRVSRRSLRRGPAGAAGAPTSSSRSSGRGDDPVDEAVAEQELGALEALRQLLRDRPGRDARAGEADERLRLGDVDVADGRERGEDAAGGRVGQDRDERHAGVAQPLDAPRASWRAASGPACLPASGRRPRRSR